ncbi:hypothetical protein [Fluviicola sp.]|uniref:hypothetical protein n=1 Tax=Fluviicola sp. TaxID=1917219 RepID=UPI00261D6D2B|nr:hypothetical protein [Fluviicola sp.]
MSFNGNEGEPISLEQGAELTGRYQTNHPNSIIAGAIGKTNIDALLAQSDCHGIRVYLGENVDGKTEYVWVGVDSNGNDILNLIIDRTVMCPTTCGGNNPLNSILKSGLK